MRFAFSFVALAAAALAAAQPSTHPLSINPDPSVAHPIPEVGAFVSTEPLTNAKRFAEGLPPLSPKPHRRRPYRFSPHRGTGIDTAPRAVSSPQPPVNAKCNILVKNAGDGTVFGYISPLWNVFGEYGMVQHDQAGALEVSFSYTESTKPVSQLDFLASNDPNSLYPFVGATVGFDSTDDDLSVGSFNYAYITGTTQTPPGSPPVEGDNNSFTGATDILKSAQSAIWEYESATQNIRPQWINSNGGAPQTQLIFANDDTQAFILTGDADAFRATFEVQYPLVTFTCVPPVTAPPS